jgi:hypothetical protein
MDDRTASPSADESPFCTKPFLLCELRAGVKDRLGNQIEDILWLGTSYAIYRSQKGIDIQFSDNRKEEDVQRRKFTEICPELCELRYFTPQISSGSNGSLYDHNIAQAMMLVMEDRAELGKKIARQALKMAVDRVTNDNTIRYVRFCLMSWLVCLALQLLFLRASESMGNHDSKVVDADSVD